MPQYDTCYFWGDEGCKFDGECPHRDEDYNCLADDEDLLTYEDFLQMKEIESHKCSEEVKTNGDG